MAADRLEEIVALLREIRDMMATPMEGIGPNDAAKFCGVSVSAWRAMNARGLCPAPAELSERCPRWTRIELRAWLLAGSPPRARWQTMRDGALRRAG